MKPIWLLVVAGLMIACEPGRAAAQPNPFPTPGAAIHAVEAIFGQKSVEQEDRSALEKARAILDEIVKEFPGSDAAAHILLEDKVGTIDVEKLDRRLVTIPSDGAQARVGAAGGGTGAETNLTLQEKLQQALSDLAAARAAKADEDRKVQSLKQRLAIMEGQIGALQKALDASASGDPKNTRLIDSLGSQLNAALAQVAAEQRNLHDAEAQKAQLLARQRPDLSGYRSEFFGEVSKVLAGTKGIKVVGDRFVVSSAVLFAPGSAQIAERGKKSINAVVSVLQNVAGQIPSTINWILQVNGYTDATPLMSGGKYRDNWELSQAQALSVVRYMISQGFPPNRLAATGFGQYQPVAKGDMPKAIAQNRRIELKLTTK